MEAFLSNPTALQTVEILIMILKFLIPIGVMVFLAVTNWNKQFETATNNTEMNISARLKNQEGYFNYDRLSSYLKRMGVDFLFGEISSPFTFLAAKLIFALVSMLLGTMLVDSLAEIGFGLTVLIALAMAVGGFFIPDGLVHLMNQMDNDEMLMDIKAIFDTLRIQTKSGVYLTYSLCECYMIVENPRLKRALLDMTSKIIAKNQIEDAIIDFNAKFENSYIDTLCITILQSLESGKSSQILDDLAKQISDMQRAINVKEQEALDRRVQVFEMLIFAGATAVLVYVLGISVLGSLMEF